MTEIILKEESYKIVGACMEVHKELGMGFKEVIYKDALEIEFDAINIPFQRENRTWYSTKEKFCRENISQILSLLIR